MQNPSEAIFRFLNEKNISYEVLEHEAVYTSEQAAQVRGLHLTQGAKSLLLKANKEFVLVILPGDKKLDSKKLKTLLGIKSLRFATPEEVKEKMGCEIGACYPFGNLINLQMFVDNNLANNDVIFFNPGIHTKSIKMKWKDYDTHVHPNMRDLSQ